MEKIILNTRKYKGICKCKYKCKCKCKNNFKIDNKNNNLNNNTINIPIEIINIIKNYVEKMQQKVYIIIEIYLFDKRYKIKNIFYSENDAKIELKKLNRKMNYNSYHYYNIRTKYIN